VETRRKTRTYDASARRAAAEQTRERILVAARDLFIEVGYAATAVSEIARRAEVSVDTVYTSVGRKPRLLHTVVDMVLASSSRPLPAAERDYVQDVRRATGARRKLETYGAALARLMPTISPLLLALRDAGLTDPECAEAWRHITERRATHMLDLAADLRVTGDVREDLTDQDVADLLWSTNSPEWYAAFTSRGRTAEEYASTLADLWCRTLLEVGPGGPRAPRDDAP
jgi:AcrR family transcriptional regulator